MRTAFILLATTIVLAAPLGLAAHDQLGDSEVRLFPFNPNLFTFYQTVDWVGVGGPGGGQPSLTGTGQLEAELSPTPDDCLDQDQRGQYAYGNYHVAFPSIASKVVGADQQTLVPGQAVPAPAELVALCSQVRSLVTGQEAGHTYGNDQQMVGFGDVTTTADTYVLPTGQFDSSLVAVPLSLTAKLCLADLATFNGASSVGDETWATYGFNNGELDVTVASCEDITNGFLDNDELQNGGTWNAGTINDAGFSVYDLSLWDLHGDGTTEVALGLQILCLNAQVVDANNAAAGFFEDYGYFWVDSPTNGYGFATFWADPANTDGAGHASDCSSVGIAV